MGTDMAPAPCIFSLCLNSLWLYSKLQCYLVGTCVGLGCVGFPMPGR